MTIYAMSKEDAEKILSQMIEQIDQAPAGPEMNAMIAERIFGFKPLSEIERSAIHEWQEMWRPGQPVTTNLFRNAKGKLDWISDWSREWRDVRHVIEEMKSLGLRLWLCDFGDYHQATFLDDEGKGEKANADTPMLAICRAALKSKLSLNKRGVLLSRKESEER